MNQSHQREGAGQGASANQMNVAVIGGGRWARALFTCLTQDPDRDVRVVRLFQLRSNERAGDLKDLASAELLLLVVPAIAARQLLREIGGHLHGGQLLIHAIGSLEPNPANASFARISDVVRQETPVRRVGVLAGPALAQDLEEGRPAALICGSRFDEVGEAAHRALSSARLRIYTTRDIVGVEVARAMVAAVALAAGVAQALDLGPAARAMLVARGAAEMARLGVALGASERTFFGLAGVGELVVATEGRGSADFELGRILGGQGSLDLQEAERQIGRTTDGPNMVREAYRLAQQHGLRMTLVTALHRWFNGERTTRQALLDLFSSSPDQLTSAGQDQKKLDIGE